MNIRKLGTPKIVIQQEATPASGEGWQGYLLGYIVPGLIVFGALRLLAMALEWLT